MAITGMATSREIVDENSLNVENWCSCIDGTLTKGNCIDSVNGQDLPK